MANSFSKEERVAFEDILQGFDDYLVMSRNCNIYRTDQESMERTQDTIWRPIPYIAESISGPAGTDISASFKDVTQLSVPASISFNKTVPWTMNAKELRDSLQNERFGKAARQKLASDINVALLDVATDEGTLVVTKSTAASGFIDPANCEKIMNEQGVMMEDRYIAYSTGDYNNLAADLAGRGTLAPPKTLTAYERAFVGEVAGFQTFKLDYSNAIAAAAGVTVTLSAADQNYTPLATGSVAGQVNHDNRTQTISIAVTSGTVAVGDCFTVANVFAVHHITKVSTGELKTFRITEIVTGAGGTGTVKISPPFIANDTEDVEAQYQNIDSIPANGAALVFLNTTAAKINPFWQKEALEILPGRLAIEEEGGVAVVRGSTEQGLEIVLTKQWDINTNKSKYRLDCLFGVVCLNPEMVGVQLFSQT